MCHALNARVFFLKWTNRHHDRYDYDYGPLFLVYYVFIGFLCPLHDTSILSPALVLYSHISLAQRISPIYGLVF